MQRDASCWAAGGLCGTAGRQNSSSSQSDATPHGLSLTHPGLAHTARLAGAGRPGSRLQGRGGRQAPWCVWGALGRAQSNGTTLTLPQHPRHLPQRPPPLTRIHPQGEALIQELRLLPQQRRQQRRHLPLGARLGRVLHGCVCGGGSGGVGGSGGGRGWGGSRVVLCIRMWRRADAASRELADSHQAQKQSAQQITGQPLPPPTAPRPPPAPATAPSPPAPSAPPAPGPPGTAAAAARFVGTRRSGAAPAGRQAGRQAPRRRAARRVGTRKARPLLTLPGHKASRRPHHTPLPPAGKTCQPTSAGHPEGRAACRAAVQAGAASTTRLQRSAAQCVKGM